MNKTNYKILILVPSPNSYGGVSNYFKTIKNQFNFPVEYFYRGVRKQNSRISRGLYPFVQIWDYLRFVFKLIFNNYSLVHINTSLGKTGLIRDYFFIRILQLFRHKYIVFFRGIDETVLEWTEKKWLPLFRSSFLKADGILVLSSYLKDKLSSYGYTNKIVLATTVVEPFLTENLFLDSLIEKHDDEKIQLLFLSRMEKAKGIYQAIDTFHILRKKGLNIRLSICGDGKESDSMKRYVSDNFDKDIIINGHVEGKKKRTTLLASHIYLFPSHQEGLPNSLLEAMAFGIPIVTSNVGGIPDFFENNKMGFMTDDISPENLAKFTERLIKNPERRKTMARFNFEYAKNRFYADKVINRLENFYREIITFGNS